MNYSEVAVVPAAFALLTAMFMYAGTKRRAEAASHTTAVIRLALFLLCTLIAIAIGSASDSAHSDLQQLHNASSSY